MGAQPRARVVFDQDPFARRGTTERLRSIVKSDRLAEIRCPAVPGRNGTGGWLLGVLLRDALPPVQTEHDDVERLLMCRCGATHRISGDALDAEWLAARGARSKVPAQIVVESVTRIAA